MYFDQQYNQNIQNSQCNGDCGFIRTSRPFYWLLWSLRNPKNDIAGTLLLNPTQDTTMRLYFLDNILLLLYASQSKYA